MSKNGEVNKTTKRIISIRLWLCREWLIYVIGTDETGEYNRYWNIDSEIIKKLIYKVVNR